TDVSIVDVAKVDNELYQEIKKKSDTYNEESQEAYIDRDWKKTPGRNGLKVNVEESYEQMKKKGTFDESLLVYEEIPPETSLQQLPAAPIDRGHPEKGNGAHVMKRMWR